MNFSKELLNYAKSKKKTIVFPEAAFSDRVAKAALYLKKNKICNVILVGDESAILMQHKELKSCVILNPKTYSGTEEFARKLMYAMHDLTITLEVAYDLIKDPFYFSTMLVKLGYADAMVGGVEVDYRTNIYPALKILNETDNFINTYTLMSTGDNLTGDIVLLTDCMLNKNPRSEELALMAERVCEQFNKYVPAIPCVAFMNDISDRDAKAREARAKFKATNKHTFCEGEKPDVKANIMVFPDLNSANICSRAMSYFGNMSILGPITLGLEKPVNTLPKDCSVRDIINLTAITILQCK